MSGDGKIGLHVGGIVRSGATRKVAGGSSAPVRGAVPVQAANDPVPAARLIGLASQLAGQTPPVDEARVASLLGAIAGGDYMIDAGAIAKAMINFHKGGSDA